MTGKERRDQLNEKIRARYHQGRTWAWKGPCGTVKVGVIEAYPGAWIVGWVSESGGGHKLNSSVLSKYQQNKDPDALLLIAAEWAGKRKLTEVPA